MWLPDRRPRATAPLRRLGQLVRLEPVRSAEPPSSSGSAGASASSAFWQALRVAIVSALLRRLAASSARRLRRSRRAARPSCGARTRPRQLGNALARRRRSSAFQSASARCAGSRWRPRPRRRRPGSRTARCGQPMRCARRGDFLGAERRAVRLAGAGLVRRALADDGLAADQRRLVAARASPCAIAASTASTSWPSTSRITCQP